MLKISLWNTSQDFANITNTDPIRICSNFNILELQESTGSIKVTTQQNMALYEHHLVFPGCSEQPSDGMREPEI